MENLFKVKMLLLQKCFLNALRLGRTPSIQVKRGSWEIVFFCFPYEEQFPQALQHVTLALSFWRPGWEAVSLDLDTV